MKMSLIGTLLLVSKLALAGIGTTKSEVNLECSGAIYGTAQGQSVILVESEAKKIEVINPWFAEYDVLRANKQPQDVVAYGDLVATVKKGVNHEKEIVLEVYTIDAKTGLRNRVGFASGDISIHGSGVSMFATVGKYQTQFSCKEIL